MSNYSFKVTKGKFQLSLTTTDKELIVDQFAKWVRQSSDYVQKQKVREGKNRISSQINAEKEITQRKIDEQLSKMPKTESFSEPVKSKRTVTEENIDVFYNMPKTVETESKKNNEQGVFDNILEQSIKIPQTE